LGLLGVMNLLAVAYIFALTVSAAVRRSQRREAPVSEDLSFLVLVPAHDEEAVISDTLESLLAMNYPASHFSVVVVADNCSDRTAAIAAGSGAEVMERDSGGAEGKGRAIAWALSRIRENGLPDAVVIVDADCVASPNLLGAMAGAFGSGSRAVQTDYVVANLADSPAAALRFAGFALMNTVRPMGKDRLGLSAGLFGTGMGFRRELLEEHPWEAFSLAEDIEYHLELVAAGERVDFLEDAEVRSAMPTSGREGLSQDQRWEGGRQQLARGWVPRLVAQGAGHRDPVRLNAALELLVPPQSLLLAGSLLTLICAIPLRATTAVRLGVLAIGTQVAYVLGTLRIVGAPASVYRSLVHAPFLVVRKVLIYVRLARDGQPATWERTERTPAEANR